MGSMSYTPGSIARTVIRDEDHAGKVALLLVLVNHRCECWYGGRLVVPNHQSTWEPCGLCKFIAREHGTEYEGAKKSMGALAS